MVTIALYYLMCPYNASRRLIKEFGDQVVKQTDGEGKGLIYYAISEGAPDCAKILFGYAADERIHVDLCCIDGDILKVALEKYSRKSVELVLENMALRCASASQTVEVLTRNLSELLKRFPDVFEKLLLDGKFSFALGKLSVPKSIFDGTDTKPIGFICDYDPSKIKWKMHEEAEVKQFLKDHCPRLREKIDSPEGEIITAVLKFVPLEDVVVSGKKASLADMTAEKCSVDVFQVRGYQMQRPLEMVELPEIKIPVRRCYVPHFSCFFLRVCHLLRRRLQRQRSLERLRHHWRPWFSKTDTGPCLFVLIFLLPGCTPHHPTIVL